MAAQRGADAPSIALIAPDPPSDPPSFEHRFRQAATSVDGGTAAILARLSPSRAVRSRIAATLSRRPEKSATKSASQASEAATADGTSGSGGGSSELTARFVFDALPPDADALDGLLAAAASSCSCEW